MRQVALAILFLCFSCTLWSQQAPINVLFVVDASSSMLKNWGKEDKWTIAEKSLLHIADSLISKYDSLRFGLRVYGHQSLPIDNDCEDTELKLAITTNTLDQLEDRLHSVNPKGITPLAFTLEQTNIDFAGLEGQKNILILITDGSESCLGDPCAILEILLEKEVIVKPVIIGLDIDIESLRDYHCIKDVFNPHHPFEFERKIMQVVTQAISFTTLQVNLLDHLQAPNQSDIPILFYSTKEHPDYTLYHRLNDKGDADTLLIDPSPSYTLIVQTIPPIVKEGIKLKSNDHNIITIPAPTSALTIQSYHLDEKVNLIPEIPYLIKQSGSEDYFYSLESNHTQEYLYGSYDIDILSLPITRLAGVKLDKPSFEIKLAAPGKLVVNARFPIHASLFTEINNELVNIYTFPANSKQEILDLQPGAYSLVYRFDHQRSMVKTKIENIQIESKETVELKF
jgi:Ca-activated chloride channel family protein